MCFHLCRAVNITADATLGIFFQKEILASDFISDPCKLNANVQKLKRKYFNVTVAYSFYQINIPEN